MSRSIVVVSLLLVTGCRSGGVNYDPSGEEERDTNTTEEDTESDSGTDTDTDTDTGTIDTGLDTGADTGSPLDTSDIDTSPTPDPTCHPFDPMGSAGWTRSYDATFRGQPATEEQAFVGKDTAGGGEWVHQSTLVASSGGQGGTPGGGQSSTMGWDVHIYQDCSSGTARVVNWNGIVDMGTGTDFDGTPSAPRTYLPAVADIHTVGHSWHYSYELTAQAMGYPVAIATEGTYTILERDDVDVLGTVYSAVVIENTFTQDRSAAFMGVFSGKSTMWYVEGLGLVREEMIDTATGNQELTKELTAYTGLTPVAP